MNWISCFCAKATTALLMNSEPAPEGTLYRNSLTVGVEGKFGRPINALIRRFLFDEARGLAWIKHNIEEVGNFESFLPQLYESEKKISTMRIDQ